MNRIIKLLPLILLPLILGLFACACYAQSNLTFNLHGLTDEMQKNAELRLNLLTETYGKVNAENINAIYSQAPQEIEQALAPYGYFKPKIRGQLKKRGQAWEAQFDIHVGHKIRIRKLSVDLIGPGADDSALRKVLHDLPIQLGDVFRTDQYEKAKEAIFQTANERGYVKAYFATNRVIIDLKHYQVDITLVLQTGPRYYFGSVTFEENPYAPRFLHRFVPFRENEPFSSEKLLHFQEQLSSSYYFNQVLVTPDFTHADNYRVPVKVALAAPKSKRFTLGVGYGTFTGPRISAGMSLRRLTNTGQHFDAQLKLSSVLSGLAGKYYIPGKNPLTDQWVTGINYQRFLPKNGSSSSATVSTGYLRKTEHLQTSANINYLIERFKVEGVPAKHSQLLYPNLNINYTEADDLIHPETGKSLNLLLRGASRAVLSTTSFLQGDLRGKYLFSPTSFSHVILKADVGYTMVKDLKDLPLSMRFFAGGLNSIRGFPDSSIGPGRYLYTGSVEYQNHIYENWSGAFFYDFGTATDHFGSKINKGVGVGVVYESIIGPVKAYVAQAISKKNRPYSLEFSIGPEF